MRSVHDRKGAQTGLGGVDGVQEHRLAALVAFRAPPRCIQPLVVCGLVRGVVAKQHKPPNATVFEDGGAGQPVPHGADRASRLRLGAHHDGEHDARALKRRLGLRPVRMPPELVVVVDADEEVAAPQARPLEGGGPVLGWVLFGRLEREQDRVCHGRVESH